MQTAAPNSIMVSVALTNGGGCMLHFLQRILNALLGSLKLTFQISDNLTNSISSLNSLVLEAASASARPERNKANCDQTLVMNMPEKVQAQLQFKAGRATDQMQTLSRLNQLRSARPSQEGNRICWYKEGTKTREIPAAELVASQHVATLKSTTARQTHYRIVIENLQTARNPD